MKDLIVALDVSSIDQLDYFLNLFNEPIYVKVGMELFYSLGFEAINRIIEKKHNVFLDLKLHDIPNTVYNAMKALLVNPISMVNVHAAGGIDMMKAAARARDQSDNKPLLIAVTMLTSTSKETMNEEILIPGNVDSTVLKYAKTAKDAGFDGVVCSAREVPLIKSKLGNDFITVTPGIRPLGYGDDDQKRIVTPIDAAKLGSDFIVVGRPITKSSIPSIAYNDIKTQFLGGKR
ncbi:MAG: orotidine-5'-phosphate decarboxylase [Tissierellia bacterium]|nr:orotidine-5'-phosphate decarboxylase [Tissierellia bacterium]